MPANENLQEDINLARIVERKILDLTKHGSVLVSTVISCCSPRYRDRVHIVYKELKKHHSTRFSFETSVRGTRRITCIDRKKTKQFLALPLEVASQLYFKDRQPKSPQNSALDKIRKEKSSKTIAESPLHMNVSPAQKNVNFSTLHPKVNLSLKKTKNSQIVSRNQIKFNQPGTLLSNNFSSISKKTNKTRNLQQNEKNVNHQNLVNDLNNSIIKNNNIILNTKQPESLANHFANDEDEDSLKSQVYLLKNELQFAEQLLDQYTAIKTGVFCFFFLILVLLFWIFSF